MSLDPRSVVIFFYFSCTGVVPGGWRVGVAVEVTLRDSSLRPHCERVRPASMFT